MTSRIKVLLLDYDSLTHDDGHFYLIGGSDVIVPFHNEDVFEFVENIADADIIPVFSRIEQHAYSEILSDFKQFVDQCSSDQTIICINHLTHVSEYYSCEHQLMQESEIIVRLQADVTGSPNVLIAHTNHKISNPIGYPNLLYTDFLWNRQVAFYVDKADKFMQLVSNNHWYPQFDGGRRSADIYQLSDLNMVCHPDRDTPFSYPNDNLCRLYLSPNRYRGAHHLRAQLSAVADQSDSCKHSSLPEVRDYLRTSLVDLLHAYPGYLSDPAMGNFLIGQGASGSLLAEQLSGQTAYGWLPMNNAYYDNSIVSIYVETVTHGTTVKSLTEKTWEPLIKGHFILPFGYHGMISDLQEKYSIKLPDWIDYSYDHHTNDLRRWAEYISEVKRVLGLGWQTLYNHKVCDAGKQLMQYNRDLFFQGYRDTLEDGLVKICDDRLNDSDVYQTLKNIINENRIPLANI